LTGTPDSHSPECVIPDDVLIQFGPPDDEHLLLETCRGINKYVKKECIKLVITQNVVQIVDEIHYPKYPYAAFTLQILFPKCWVNHVTSNAGMLLICVILPAVHALYTAVQ
jgi:hypothetical protein